MSYVGYAKSHQFVMVLGIYNLASFWLGCDTLTVAGERRRLTDLLVGFSGMMDVTKIKGTSVAKTDYHSNRL